MNFKRAIIVYKKEMLEMFRDRRTIFSTILLPFIMYPLIFIGFSSLMSRQTAKLEQKGATVAIIDSVDAQTYKLFTTELAKLKSFSFVPYTAAIPKQITDKNVHAVITIRDSIPKAGLPVYSVTIKADKSSDQGKMIFEKLSGSMRNLEQQILINRLAERQIDAEFIKPLRVQEQDTATSQKRMGAVMGMILPYLLITLLISGAAVVASDMIAGEKERKTLETLLVSSAHRNEIVLGKYLTTITFAMINVVVNLASLYFSMKSVFSQGGMQMSGVKFPLDGFFMLFLALIPLATLYAAVLLSISSFSRNMKEARSYEQPILLISMLLAMISWFPGFELNAGLALIPVINISLLFKAIMIGEYQILHFLMTVGSTLLLDIIAIIVTIRLFNSENVLFRSDEEPSLKQIRKSQKLFFTPYIGMVYYLVALAALYYLGTYLQKKDIVSGLIQTQILIIMLPVLLILRVIKQDYRQVTRMNKTKPQNFLIVPFIAVSGAILVTLIAQLINLVYPFPADYLAKMSGLLNLPDLKIWQVYLLIAVLPGVCEEILFRGFIIRFFESNGKWISILVSAALFALFHLDPYRFLPVLLLGILLGWLLIKSNSIYISMFSHAVNNSLALAFTNLDKLPFVNKYIVSNDQINWWMALPAGLLLCLGLYLFAQINRSQALPADQ